jgi:hypothetical protein
VINRLDPDREDKVAFISQFDDNESVFAIELIAPINTKGATLFVFWHGMGQTCMEPFEKPDGSPFSETIISRDHTCILMSPNYRSPAEWVSDGALSAITQAIRSVSEQYPVERIYLIGNSMDACVSPE